MKKLLLLSILALTMSCGKENHTTIVNPIVTQSSEIPAVQVDIENLVADENEYRVGQGQAPLSAGLSCALQTFTVGERIQASITVYNTLQGLTNVGAYTLKAAFNQQNSNASDGLNILPTSMKNTYKTNYLLRCTGYVVVTESDYYQFDLTSDDASILYIAGAKVIDNDNAHGVTLKTGTKFLRRGVHSFRLDYAQNGGAQALILNMNGELLSKDRMVR